MSPARLAIASGLGVLGLLFLRAPLGPRSVDLLLDLRSVRELADPTGVVRQDRSRNCGAAALSTAAARLGRPLPLREAERLSGTDATGVSLLGLRDAARQAGLAAHGVRARPPDERALARLLPPAILRTHGSHFVVLEAFLPGEGESGARVVVSDPAVGRFRSGARRFCRRWDGYALLVGRGEAR